ncbi:MAG TPA: SPFH domain-containing protein [Bacillota bacterium]|nr:SPFH domain-containing protein [Bacillota bacterium]
MGFSPIQLFIVVVLGVFAFLSMLSFRYIPNNKVGIVEKLWSRKGSLKSGLITLAGEAGFQPDILRGGWHLLMPFQYRIHRMPLVTITQGKIGYIFARDGKLLPPMQTLAENTVAGDFQDATGFLKNGGQRGPQRKILREGTYAINLAQFVVLTYERIYYLSIDDHEKDFFKQMADMIHERKGFDPVIIKGSEDHIGIVTVHDGPSLPSGQIIAPTVGENPADPTTYHNNFQEPDAFLRAGGMRGRQLQVLVEGTYYVNRLFGTVEMVPKTVIEVGNAGVVVSYTGNTGVDVSGVDYKHGELVDQKSRGVWKDPLLPGKYAFNTYAGKVISVPTTNFILKWNRSEIGTHHYDENLAEVSLITKDAFEPSLPLSVVVHIDYRKAPMVIQRFGDIKRLVEQTLDPMVSAYFKNIGQTRTLIQLLQERSAIQQISAEEMREKFAQYNLELQEVLIGTPASPASAPGSAGGGQIEQILTQLRSRQIAEEQIETYTKQEKAAVKERELREAEVRAKQQANITESEISITVQTNQGKADYARAQQQAAQMQVIADAEGNKIRLLGEGEARKIQALAAAEAERAARVGIAQAMAIEEQVRAYGGPQLQLAQEVLSKFAEAIKTAGVDVVPKVIVAGAGEKDGGSLNGNVMESLLTLLMSDKLGIDLKKETKPRSAMAEKILADMKNDLEKKTK